MKKFSIAALTVAVGIASGMISTTASAEDFVAGKDYTVIANPEKIEGSKIIVREFFWYGCPHCYRLEPYMHQWVTTKPADVAFLRTPAAMNPVWEQNARGFYAAQLMGYEAQTHMPMFEAIQKDGKKLFDKASIGQWYASQGLDINKFNELYNSFSINTKIARANDATRRYQIAGTPVVVVDGKYLVEGEDGKMPKVVDFLVKKARAEHGK